MGIYIGSGLRYIAVVVNIAYSNAVCCLPWKALF